MAGSDAEARKQIARVEEELKDLDGEDPGRAKLENLLRQLRSHLFGELGSPEDEADPSSEP
jgi:hypothetical protein